MARRSPTAWTAVLAWCAVCGWFAFVRETRVPLLGLVDFGFHELGHLVMYVFPISELLTAAMGSITQVGVPLGLAVYFFWFRRDGTGAAVCAAWAATSLQDASVYIADAPYERLQLVGGEHDWAYVLGPDGLDRIDQAASIASAVRGAGLAVLLVVVAYAVVGLANAVATPARIDPVSTRVADRGAATAPTPDDLFPTASRTPSSDRDHRTRRW